MITIRHETNFNTIGFIRYAKVGSKRQLTHLFFFHIPKGKHDFFQNLSFQTMQHIRLIFIRIYGPVQLCPIGTVYYFCIVPGCNMINSQHFAIGPELSKFEPVIANNTRVWRTPGKVFMGEIIHDLAKFRFKVESIKRDVEFIRYPTGIARIKCAAAAFFSFRTSIFGAVHSCAHEYPNNLIALIYE